MAKQDQIEQYRFDKRTPEEQREIARQGGIASGKVRQEKATMKATLEKLLDEKNKKGITYRELATLGLIQGAVKGNAQNYRTILEVIGELVEGTSLSTPTVKIEISDNSSLEKTLYEANKHNKDDERQ